MVWVVGDEFLGEMCRSVDTLAAMYKFAPRSVEFGLISLQGLSILVSWK